MFIKIAATTTEEAKILFYYNRETLFNDVSLLSSFMARNIQTKDGQHLTDDYSISTDEKDLVDVCTRNCLPDIYDSLIKISLGHVPAFKESVTETGETAGTDISGETVTLTGSFVEMAIKDNMAYNDNVLTLVDGCMYNAIQYGVLKEFYSTVVNADLLDISTKRFMQELLKLEQRLFQLKKKSRVH